MGIHGGINERSPQAAAAFDLHIINSSMKGGTFELLVYARRTLVFVYTALSLKMTHLGGYFMIMYAIRKCLSYDISTQGKYELKLGIYIYSFRSISF